MMQLYLVDQSPEVVEALRAAFSAHPDVIVQQGDVLDLGEDAIVSPANSLGLMDGGLDDDYLRFFGIGLQSQIQKLIAQLPEGSLPVGSAMIVSTGHHRISRLIVAPTVAVPGPTTTACVYFAMSAALRAAKRAHPPIRVLFCPGLGTGIGQVPPAEAAAEMARAYARHHTARPYDDCAS
jgi:O-acetyl-ADP-ribose deacetylase (regulator of RNase III)